MPIYDFIKNLFRLPENKPTNKNDNRNDYRNQFLNRDNEPYEDVWRPSNDERSSDNISRFNIFTDPLEMHRYFEEQINEVLKSFGMFDRDGKSFFGLNDLPALGPSSEFGFPSGLPETESSPKINLRDQFLKPGYSNIREDNPTVDSDLDGKVNAGDLDILLKDRSSNDRSLLQIKEYAIPQVRTFGQSITSKTICGPDGSVETHRTVRDNAGNEETTITRKMGDKHYTVTVRTDKHGRQEKIEDMRNIDEQELSRFTDNWSRLEPPQIDPNLDFNNWFEKLFKE